MTILTYITISCYGNVCCDFFLSLGPEFGKKNVRTKERLGSLLLNVVSFMKNWINMLMLPRQTVMVLSSKSTTTAKMVNHKCWSFKYTWGAYFFKFCFCIILQCVWSSFEKVDEKRLVSFILFIFIFEHRLPNRRNVHSGKSSEILIFIKSAYNYHRCNLFRYTQMSHAGVNLFNYQHWR